MDCYGIKFSWLVSFDSFEKYLFGDNLLIAAVVPSRPSTIFESLHLDKSQNCLLELQVVVCN